MIESATKHKVLKLFAKLVHTEIRRVTSRLSSVTVVSRRGDEGKEGGGCRGETIEEGRIEKLVRLPVLRCLWLEDT